MTSQAPHPSASPGARRIQSNGLAVHAAPQDGVDLPRRVGDAHRASGTVRPPSAEERRIGGAEDRELQVEWIPIIIGLAPDANRRAILEALAGPAGHEVQRRKELTPEEKLARWEERVKQEFGAAGLRLAEEMRK